MLMMIKYPAHWPRSSLLYWLLVQLQPIQIFTFRRLCLSGARTHTHTHTHAHVHACMHTGVACARACVPLFPPCTCLL